jgi:hypothetical protein
MRAAAVRGYEPSGGGRDVLMPYVDVLLSYVDDLGPWLAEEYARVHGVKAPRPDQAGTGA